MLFWKKIDLPYCLFLEGQFCSLRSCQGHRCDNIGRSGELTGLFVDCRPLATLAGLILVTRHTMRSVNGSTAVWTSLFWNREADRARDESIASERSVGGIANRVNGHGTATSLLWISGGIDAGGNFPAELFASSDGHSWNGCSVLSFS